MPNSSLFSIVLAAGSARRFGSSKQLALLDEKPLVSHAIRTAEEVCGPRTVIILGDEWKSVADACKPLAGFFVLNPDFESGVGSSIQVGVSSIANQAGAVLLLLADQPLVTAEHLRALEKTWRKDTDKIVASAYRDTEGPPLIFPQRDFAALRLRKGDQGAKSLLLANRQRLTTVTFEAAGTDIDVPADLASLVSE